MLRSASAAVRLFYLAALAVAAADSIPAFSASYPLPETTRIWAGGEDGIKVYSIPGVLVTTRGTVLAYAEARHEGRGDGGKVDLVIKRSTDGGRNWSASHFIERAQGKENYVLATLAADRVSGRIFFFSAKRDEGLADRTSQNVYRWSDDDGITWSEPVDITSILYAADEKVQDDIRTNRAAVGFTGDDPALFGRKLVFFGPGRSIQLSAHHSRFPQRIVVPLFYIKDRVATPRAKRGYGNAVLVSDDGGRSWSVPGIVPLGDLGSSETSVVELDDGRLLLNSRAAPPESKGMVVAGRTLALSADGGSTWTRPVPDTSGIPRYVETHSGLLRVSAAVTDPAGKSRMLYSFPASLPAAGQTHLLAARANGTLLLSYDNHHSWARKKLLVPGSFGYGNLDLLPDGNILLIHEDALGSEVRATRFTIDWLTDGQDHLAANRPADEAVREVLCMDEARIAALMKGDAEALARLFDETCVYVHASGRVQSGSEYLESFRSGEVRYLAMRHESPPTVRLHANGTAVVTGRIALEAKAPMSAVNRRSLVFTAVYLRHGGAWRLVSYQSTPPASAPPK